jgi:hypothetical protein
LALDEVLKGQTESAMSKMNIEGAELDALDGARPRPIRRWNPKLGTVPPIIAPSPSMGRCLPKVKELDPRYQLYFPAA